MPLIEVDMYFEAIADAAERRSFATLTGAASLERQIRSDLDVIKDLLKEDEPETLASSVLRLTDLYNQLEAENHKLKQDLASAERRIKSLQATCGKVMAEAGVTELRASNVRLLRQNQKLEEDLNLADTHIEELQKDLARLKREFDLQERYIGTLKRETRNYNRRLVWWTKLYEKNLK